MALLVWSLISFLVGIMAFTILDTETHGHVSNVAFAIIALAGVVLVLMFLAMWNLSKLWASNDGTSTMQGVARAIKVVKKAGRYILWWAVLRWSWRLKGRRVNSMVTVSQGSIIFSSRVDSPALEERRTPVQSDLDLEAAQGEGKKETS
jgi:hypothetical protein